MNEVNNNQNNMNNNMEPNLMNNMNNNMKPNLMNNMNNNMEPNLMNNMNNNMEPNLMNNMNNNMEPNLMNNMNNMQPDLMNNMNNNMNNSIQNNTQQNTNKNYASAGERIIAYIKDYLGILGISFLIIMILFVLTSTINFIIAVNNPNAENGLSTGISFFTTLAWMGTLHFGYEIKFIMNYKKYSGTKAMFKKNIVVLNEDGTTLTNSQVYVRALLMVLLSSFSLVSIITMIATEKHQTLYDMILKQEVVKKQ